MHANGKMRAGAIVEAQGARREPKGRGRDADGTIAHQPMPEAK
jgi:hypothetical protein